MGFGVVLGARFGVVGLWGRLRGVGLRRFGGWFSWVGFWGRFRVGFPTRPALQTDSSWRRQRILNVPLCREDCEQWWEDCRDASTCKVNWHKGWNWSTGTPPDPEPTRPQSHPTPKPPDPKATHRPCPCRHQPMPARRHVPEVQVRLPHAGRPLREALVPFLQIHHGAPGGRAVHPDVVRPHRGEPQRGRGAVLRPRLRCRPPPQPRAPRPAGPAGVGPPGGGAVGLRGGGSRCGWMGNKGRGCTDGSVGMGGLWGSAGGVGGLLGTAHRDGVWSMRRARSPRGNIGALWL